MVGARAAAASAAKVTPQATPWHQTWQNHPSAEAVNHPSKQQALRTTTRVPAGKAAGERQCLQHRPAQSETSEYRRVSSIRMM